MSVTFNAAIYKPWDSHGGLAAAPTACLLHFSSMRLRNEDFKLSISRTPSPENDGRRTHSHCQVSPRRPPVYYFKKFFFSIRQYADNWGVRIPPRVAPHLEPATARLRGVDYFQYRELNPVYVGEMPRQWNEHGTSRSSVLRSPN